MSFLKVSCNEWFSLKVAVPHCPVLFFQSAEPAAHLRVQLLADVVSLRAQLWLADGEPRSGDKMAGQQELGVCVHSGRDLCAQWEVCNRQEGETDFSFPVQYIG